MQRLHRRAVLVAIGLVAVGGLAGCAGRPAERGDPIEDAASTRVQESCDPARSAPFDCHVYVTERGTDPQPGRASWLRTEPVKIWVEPLNGRPTLIVDGPVNALNVAINVSGSTATTDPSSVAEGAVGCASATPACQHDEWLSGFFGHRVAASVRGPHVELTDDAGQSLSLVATGDVPPR